MTTKIFGKHYGAPYRVTSDDAKVLALLEETERSSYGHSCDRQGTSGGTFWVGPQVLAEVEALLAEGTE